LTGLFMPNTIGPILRVTQVWPARLDDHRRCRDRLRWREFATNTRKFSSKPSIARLAVENSGVVRSLA